jgi:hypothetical protein
MPAWALKAVATTLTMLFALLTAHHVSANLKSQAAPLHPSVLQVSSGVRAADVEPVTTTYAS